VNPKGQANQGPLARSWTPSPAGWADGPGPLHQRLAASIESAIARGELAPGVALPTERDLAELASVSRSTAAHAYRTLKQAGRIDSRQGRGTWVAEPRSALRGTAGGIAPVLINPDDAIDLSLAASAPSPELWAAIDDAVVRSRRSLAGVGYDPAGLAELRAAVGDRPDEVLITSGAQQAISLVVDELVAPGAAVVVEDVTYVGVIDAARRVGAHLVAVPTGIDGVDVDALVEAVERHRPALVYLNPTHHSPSGSVLPDAGRAAIADLSRRTRTPVVDDTTLAALAFDAERRPRPLGSFDLGAPIITIGSLSKSMWAGLRVGWVRADRRLVERLTRRRMVADLGGSLLSQAVALELFGRLDVLAAARADELGGHHRHLVDLLHRHFPEWVPADVRGGTAAWVRVPGDASRFARRAAEHGVHVVAGPDLSPHGGAADHLRLALGPSTDLLDEAVRRLAVAWSTAPDRPAIVV